MTQARLSRLDFLKGSLVLIMLAYHCGSVVAARHPESQFLLARLHFIHPAFLFLVGLMVGLHYRPQAQSQGAERVRQRLLGRGAKLGGLFLMLNLMVYALGLGYSPARLTSEIHGPADVLRQLFMHLDGSLAAAEILWIIALFLIFSGLLIGCLNGAVTMALAAIFWIASPAGATPTFLCVAMFGVLAGFWCHAGPPAALWERRAGAGLCLTIGWLAYLPLARVAMDAYERFALARPLIYLLEIGLWFAVVMSAYPLTRGGYLAACLERWGRYTLPAYCLQMALVHVLSAVLAGARLNFWPHYLACLALGAVLQHFALWGVDRLRQKAPVVDRLYRLTFS